MTTEAKNSIFQFLKFGVVGVLNTLVDLGVFNLLIFLFGLVSGPLFIVLKAISFTVAVTNSYFMNKHLVFNAGRVSNLAGNGKSKEFSLFFIVSVVGLLLNVLVSYAVFMAGKTLAPETSHYLFANTGAILGSGVVMLWNFLGYKFFVFKK
ncbi:MAG: GtrA family protein [Candidatus Yonathbacteria bacterium]|nr:GtrA family protein [Candidatus Yonathbacteria bacterium]